MVAYGSNNNLIRCGVHSGSEGSRFAHAGKYVLFVILFEMELKFRNNAAEHGEE